ncbi:MAG: 30S ribosomal protein S20 [Chthoniobacterales bacterium]
MASKAPVKKNKSAIKRAQQGAVRHARNTSVITNIKTQEKKVLKAIEGELATVKDLFTKLVSALDKAVKKGVLHKNKADRKKSVFTNRVTAGKSTVKAANKPKAPKGESAKDKSKAKAKIKAKAKK